MTPEPLEALGPAFADYRQPCLCGWGSTQTFDLLGGSCPGRLCDRARTTWAPLARYAGGAVRTRQEFRRDHVCSWEQLRDLRPQHGGRERPGRPSADLGSRGMVAATGRVTKGTPTPGVPRPRCGAGGTPENGSVPVHRAVARGRYKPVGDADRFLPPSWDPARGRGRQAGLPEDVVYRPTGPLALGPIARARARGSARDGRTWDAGDGDKPGFLTGLDDRPLGDVGAGPKACRGSPHRPRRRPAGQRAATLVRPSPAFYRPQGRHVRLHHQRPGDSPGPAKAARRWGSGGGGRCSGLLGARPSAPGEEKDCVSNAPAGASLGRLLRLAFGRGNVAHGLRTSPGAGGGGAFQGRHYLGRRRHRTRCLLPRPFAAGPAARLRGDKGGGDAGAALPGVEPPVRSRAGGARRHESVAVPSGRHR